MAETTTERLDYLRGGLTGVTCDTCAVHVLVKKHSQAHTSVQWSLSGVHQCSEFAARAAAGEQTALIATCRALRASIERAVREGHVEVPRP